MVRTLEELNIVAKIDNTYIVLMNDVEMTAKETIEITADVVLDLGGHTITGAGKVIRAYGNGVNAVVKNGRIVSGTDALSVFDGATLVADGLDVTSTECCAIVSPAGNLVINGGTYTSNDNFVLMTNGSKGAGKNKIVVNGGTFNGNITTAGYIAGGIYVANDDEVIVNGGTFNIVNGIGIMARSGRTTVKEGVTFNITSTAGGITAGWVGDKKVEVPTGKEIVLDLISAYPGGIPTVTAEHHDVYTLQWASVDSEESLKAALNDNLYVTLANDIQVAAPVEIVKRLTLDLGGHTITGAGKVIRAYGNGVNAVVKNGRIVSGTDALSVFDGATLVADGLDVTSTECCAIVSPAGNLVINGGTYTSNDNFVLMTNGSKGAGKNKIVVNGGTFNGNITTAGYIAGGIYVANDDEVIVNGGTFNIVNGIGIMARSGRTTVKEGVTFNITSTAGGITAGWVGDKKVYVPAGKEIVLDTISEYPGGAPSVTAESHTVFTLEKTSADSEDALRAAIENGTYVVLSRDIDLAWRIDVTKNLTIDLGGHKVTMSAGNTTGQAFNVIGANVVIENGSIDGTALTQTAGSSVKGECDPVIARNGAVVTLKNLNVTIDSITGACAYAFTGSRINVVSGTYVNNTTEDYPYAPSVKALTLNQANESNRLVFVTGGTFKGNSPANGDDSGKVATFVADGYKTVENADGSVKVVKA